MSKLKLAGWILSVLLLFFMCFSASGKFLDWEGKEEMFARMGFTTELMFRIGVLEVAVAILFLIPRTGFLGAILLTGYLGGAVVTHLRVNDPAYFPVIIGILVWIALGMRNPLIFLLALGQQPVIRTTASDAAT